MVILRGTGTAAGGSPCLQPPSPRPRLGGARTARSRRVGVHFQPALGALGAAVTLLGTQAPYLNKGRRLCGEDGRVGQAGSAQRHPEQQQTRVARRRLWLWGGWRRRWGGGQQRGETSVAEPVRRRAGRGRCVPRHPPHFRPSYLTSMATPDAPRYHLPGPRARRSRTTWSGRDRGRR